MLEPVVEAAFEPISPGFRPQAAISGTRSPKFTNTALQAIGGCCMQTLRCAVTLSHILLCWSGCYCQSRINAYLVLVKAFSKAGVLTESGEHQNTHTGTSQGNILSPVLTNIALPGLDEYRMQPWKPCGSMSTAYLPSRRRVTGLLSTTQSSRVADDCVVLSTWRPDTPEACKTK